MIRTARGLFYGIVALLALTSCTPEKPKIGIDLTPCRIGSLEAKCGKLPVYENPQAQTGRRFDLNLAVIPSQRKDKAPDPLFFLAGGPGQAATEAYSTLAGAFSRINRQRDIVLVDQRGTGKSNPLTCPQPEGASLEVELSLTAVQACIKKLKGDPRFYHTAIAMQDLDQVRNALGYERINLYGVSYGTRAAQVYLQNYPDRVRSMILDGVVPQDWNLGESMAQDAQRSWDLIQTRCMGDPSCQSRFPQLEQEFQALQTRLVQQPVQVTIAHPTTGKATIVTLNHTLFINLIRLFSYTPETVVLLPLAIHQAHTTGDFRPLAAQALLSFGQVGETLNEALLFSVICTEDVPFYKTQTQGATYLGDFAVNLYRSGCSVWPKGTISPNAKVPVRSAVPTLILSGEADPVTPPANGEQVAQSLSQSLHLVAPGQAHVVIGRGCIPQIAAKFIDQGTVQSLDTACVRQIQALPFFVDFTGPSP